MSDGEDDFLRQFEDEESCDPPNVGFGRQQSKLSEALSHQKSMVSAGGGFYKQDSGMGGIGTPMSSHIDLNKAESHMSAQGDGGRRSATNADTQIQNNPGDEFPTMGVRLADL